jgi:hypothetical protein
VFGFYSPLIPIRKITGAWRAVVIAGVSWWCWLGFVLSQQAVNSRHDVTFDIQAEPGAVEM